MGQYMLPKFGYMDMVLPKYIIVETKNKRLSIINRETKSLICHMTHHLSQEEVLKLAEIMCDALNSNS